jgi:hypothetical protein
MKNLNQQTKDYFTFYGSVIGLSCVIFMIAYIICAENVISVEYIKMPVMYMASFASFVLLLIVSGIMFILNILKKYNIVVW